MIGTPIAFGLTMIVCFTLFYYYWRIRQLRARLLSAQTSTPLQEVNFPAEFGIGKNVVETFPTIKACELKCTASEDLQCPICLVEYEEWEVLRQLPFCGHIFHTLCVGAWFEKQTTCPVCRMSMSELTESFGESLIAESIRIHCRRISPSSDATTVEVLTDSSATPSWMTLNRRLPLPAPPVPGMTTEATLPCTCPGSGNFQSETEPKTATEDVQDLNQTCLQHADFHVVNIPQEEWTHTSRSNKVPTTQPTSDGAVDISRCDSNADDSTSADAKVQEDLQPDGSFEFQPVLTPHGGLTFRAMTL